MSKLETKQVLITVKAPPNPSRQHQETNCCAGIDLATGKWVRLYPVPLRLLDDDKKFPKYSVISVRCGKPLRDKRPESRTVDRDSIKVLRLVGAENEWSERRRIVLPTLSPSFCGILEDERDKRSLGVFKPSDVMLEFDRSVPKNEKKRRAAYDQYRLFDRRLRPAEQVPYSFYYRFKCHDWPDCRGHRLLIHDLELMQAYRRWRTKYAEEALLLTKMKETWLERLCGLSRDTYFYVGSVWKRPKQFMVLGVFYPPKTAPTLFG